MKTKTPTLSYHEIDRLAVKLAGVLECDSDSMALLTLLINHLEQVREDSIPFHLATSSIKSRLFAVTIESGEAQRSFEAKAKAQRGRLLDFQQAKRA